jgi:hypothetical protein
VLRTSVALCDSSSKVAFLTRSKGLFRLLRSPLFHFLLAGGVLFLIEAAWSWAPAVPVVRVAQSEISEHVAAYQLQMGRSPTPEEARAIENKVVEDALWLEQAFSLGLVEIDPVIRQRLVLNMRFLERETGASDESEEALVARAIELGMDRSDTVVQRRLINRVQAIVRAGVRARPLEPATLEAHYGLTAEKWREPALLDLSHVYLSRDKRGDDAEADARRLLARIQAESMSPEAAVREGDPFLAGHHLRGASPARIVARLGPAFASGIENEVVGEWFGPVESAFGLHLVWIHHRKASRIPELGEVEKRVYEDWIEQESRKALRDHIDGRRAAVELRIIDDVREPGH